MKENNVQVYDEKGRVDVYFLISNMFEIKLL